MKNTTDWIELYLDYSSYNEAPKHFHFWTALGILGAAMKRNVYVRSFGTDRIFPTFFTLIVAPSGTGKTVAIDLGLNILSKVGNINILPEKCTPEAVMRRLYVQDEMGLTQSQGVLFADELSAFLDKSKHNAGIVPFLLAITKQPMRWEYATISGGSLVMERMAFSLIAGTAPDLLVDAIPPSALKTGFMARIIVVPYLEGVTKNVSPLMAEDEQDRIIAEMTVKESLVITGLNRLMTLRGAIKIPKDTLAWYNSWYFNHKVNAPLMATDKEKYSAYLNRRPVHVIRVAEAINIGRGRGLIMAKKSFIEAHEALTYLESGLSVIYDDIDVNMGVKMTLKDTNNLVLGEITKTGKGYMMHSPLSRKLSNKLKGRELREITSDLSEAGILIKKRTKTGGMMYILASKWAELQPAFNAGILK